MAVKQTTTKVVKTEDTKAADAPEAPAAPAGPGTTPDPAAGLEPDVAALAAALAEGALPAGDGVNELEPDPELDAFTAQRAAFGIYAGNSTLAARRAARLAREAQAQQ